MSKDVPEKLKPFTFHGVNLQVDGRKKTVQGDCPLCGKEDHFYVKSATGQWSCQRCGEKGNIPIFLRELHAAGRRVTTEKDLKDLANDRGVSTNALKAWGVVRHPVRSGEWIIPAFNTSGKLANIYRVVRDGEKWKALPTTGQKAHPFRPLPASFTDSEGSSNGATNKNQLWALEGPWDGMAAWDLLASFRTVGPLGPGARLIPTKSATKSLLADTEVLAVPGAQVFPEDWSAYFEGRAASLLYDNDHPKKTPTGKVVKPGWDGMQRVKKILDKSAHRPKTLHLIQWGGPKGYTKDLPDGHDVRDHINHLPSKKKALEDLLAHLKPVRVKTGGTTSSSAKEGEEPQLEPIPRSTFTELCEDFKGALHFTQVMKDTLAVMLSVVISTELEGDQIWVRVIGPPGSGKTTLAECIGAAKEWTVSRSVITGFHSGFVDPEARKADSSMMPTIDGKTFIVKDADTLISAPGRDKILSELRDIYDGTSRAQYRNRKVAVYEGLRVTFLLCGTDELRTLNRTFLGERFLDVEILGDTDATPYLDSALDNAYSRVVGSLRPRDSEVQGEEQGIHLKRATIGYIKHLKETLKTVPIPDLPPSQAGQIKAMGQILSLMRAKVRRDAGDVSFRPRAELATRIVSQLVKLGITLAIVHQKPTIDRDIIRILRKVILDTAEGFTMEVTRLLAYNAKGLSTRQISHEISIPETSVRRILNDLSEFKVVEKNLTSNNSGIRGRNLHLWKLKKEVRDLWTTGIGRKK